MAVLLGINVGTPLAASPPQSPKSKHSGGAQTALSRDVIELNAAAINDLIALGTYHVDALIDPIGSQLSYDALGASVTLSIGDSVYPAALAAAASASSAGSRNVMASVNIANWFKPLWEVLGYASRSDAITANSKGITLYAKIAGAAATGTVSWQIMGYNG